MRYFQTWAVLSGLLWINAVAAETELKPEVPSIKSFRYEEDYAYLKDKSKRSDFWDPVKYMPLPLPESYLSVDGELRERYQNIGNYDFGLTDKKNDDYVLQRVLLHADLLISPYFRSFIQFGSHYAFGKQNEKTPVEENHLDLQEAFGEFNLPLGDYKLRVRGGRQEMNFGSERLVSLRNNPNIRRSFDAVRVGLVRDKLKLDAFYAVPLELRQGVFDDDADPKQSFWGMYAVLNKPFGINDFNIDAYYLGLDKAEVAYTQGTATEHRHSIGARLWGKPKPWDYNFEFVYQFGSFGDADIQAWTAASDTGYRWSNVALTPRLGLKADIISGDNNPNDHTLRTFNPLFPKLAYFSESALIVPANLFNVFPYLDLELMDDVDFTIGWDFLWRYSTHDAFYTNPFEPLAGTEQSHSRYIGSELTLEIAWKLNRNIEINTAYVHLFSGKTLSVAGANDVDFFMLMGSYRF
jgi:hypothetical protein